MFWLPIEQYQKDGRIVRGLQRGANSFTTSTAMAALELTNRLVQAIQVNSNWPYCDCFISTSCSQSTHIRSTHFILFCIDNGVQLLNAQICNCKASIPLIYEYVCVVGREADNEKQKWDYSPNKDGKSLK